MKKLSLTLLIAATTLLWACAKQGSGSENTAQTNPAMKKTLVAYFSATGTTARVATTLAKAADADLFEIAPEEAYTAADLDWRDKQSRSTVEMQSSASRPAVAGKVENMAQYDTIYVGFPIWWYTAPRIINTFLEQYDLSGKTLIPFATSGGSGMADIAEQLKKASAPNANWQAGRLLNGNPDEATLRQWVEELKK